MKNRVFARFIIASFFIVMNGLLLNIYAQGEPDVTINFTSSIAGGVGGDATGGIGGGRPSSNPDFTEAEDPRVELRFSIDPAGQISLDAYTPATVTDVIDVVNAWDNSAIGATSNSDLFGKSFSLVVRGESRMQLGYNGGEGIGIRGRNQGRLDDIGDATEWLNCTLEGEVGIDFVEYGFVDVNVVAADAVPQAVLIDHDSQNKVEIPATNTSTPVYTPATEYNMRYFSDMIMFTTDSSEANSGYRVYSLAFNVVTPEPKPPAVVSTTPAHADTTMETTADYIIEFDVPIDQTTASAGIIFDPTLPNRSDAWDNDGLIVTISHDQLPYSTNYVVKVTTDLKATNTLSILADTTFTFKTLPEPPTVISTFPANLDEKVPVTSPFEIEFSNGMVPDSVEKAIEFTPAVTGLDFIWNEDNSIAYFTTDELSPSTQYFVTVGTASTDRFGVQMASPYQYVFTTAAPVAIQNQRAEEMVVYPNPADDIMSIRGVEVQSVKIYSITGQIVRDFNNKSVFNVSDIKPGSYIINVLDKGDNSYKELIVIK